MQTGLKVLLVEDQHDIAANIWDYLERRGYVIDHAADGESGLSRALKGDLDVIVLDLGLPRLDGLDLCRSLRAAGHGIPVLMLTARDTLDDKLRGFAEGADDYMVKPFSMRELEVRIQAVYRRGRPATDAPLRVGDLRYDPKSMLATRAGQTRALTRVQGILLATLMREAPNVIPHRRLIEAAWRDEGGDSAALQTHIYELRLLLDKPFAHAMIQSVRGAWVSLGGGAMNALRISLRRRVALAYTVLGLVLSLLFAAATVFITEDYEHILVDEILRGQADDYALRLAANPDTILPQSHRLSGYLRRIDGSGNVPAELAALAPGIHESTDDSAEGIHVGVFDTDQGRLYFVIDLSDIERLERHLEWFLLGVIVLGTGLACWLGWLLADVTVVPVRRLAEAVDALPTRPQPSALAAEASHDELGRLAASIDRYQARLVEADAQERMFFADASHELRTPIAVVRGAAELLLDEPALPDRTRGVLQRLDRGVREMTDLLDVVLDLGRRRELEFESVDASALLREAITSLQEGGAHSSVDIKVDAAGTWRVPKRESLLVLRGVLRHLLPPDGHGTLLLRGESDGLEMSYVATEGALALHARSAAPRSDSGLAVTLLGRLAAVLQWDLEEVSPDPVVRRVRIRLPHAHIQDPTPASM